MSKANVFSDGAYRKALDLYLRGFKSCDIRRRCGISTQQLLVHERACGRRYDKNDIVRYQVAYIRDKYDADAIEAAYRAASEKHVDLDAAAHRKQIVVLGCCFGQFGRVMREFLGQERARELRDECWYAKQSATMRARYGCANAFEADAYPRFVSPEAQARGRATRRETMLERYGVEHPNQSPAIMAKALRRMRDTSIDRYGVEHPMQDPEIAAASCAARQKTMLARYGAANSASVSEIRERIFESRRAHGTLTTSKPEEMLYAMLCERFGEADVMRNHVLGERYPFAADFYVKSRDMVIELNGWVGHGGHWYDPDDVSDRQRLESWRENAVRKPKYRNMVDTWCRRDVERRECAERHGLNYAVFWDGGSISRNGVSVPSLVDAREWFDAGCPDRQDWKRVSHAVAETR